VIYKQNQISISLITSITIFFIAAALLVNLNVMHTNAQKNNIVKDNSSNIYITTFQLSLV